MTESQQYDELSDDQLRAIDSACMEFERALRQAEPVTIESLLPSVVPQIRTTLFRELLSVELEARLNRDEEPNVAEYETRFPDYSAEIFRAFAETEKLVASSHASVQILKAGQSMSAVRMQADIGIAPDHPGSSERTSSSVSQETTQLLPRHLGRYRLDKIVGQGAFGVVYQAHDEQLNRVVAVKTPHESIVADSQKAKAYLTEAQLVAGLDHPHIVPVYDFGSTDTVACYIVSRFIDGGSLSARLKRGSLSYADAATLTASIAEALQAAHRKGLIHRDVKPGNILIDTDGKAWLTDFGLALRDDNTLKGPKYVGTPAYMSPEQARGEEHRIDGRSDIFSLGAVLYEMLTGRPPFRASNQADLLQRIATTSPRPLRQYDEHIPRELERICLRALSQRASDRYATAHDMAENLREFLKELSSQQGTLPGERLRASVGSSRLNGSDPSIPILSSRSLEGSDAGLRSGSDLIKVVPRGLSSFDGHDAEFFLELLPGPRDRNGLPDSIRFWKRRIEETDADSTFAIGLIYGPSGCGKSSLMKAGLIPCLSPEVTTIYVEATDKGTENLLLRRLRNEYPELSKELGLTETLIALRREIIHSTGPKLLIVLDQFEQWLHSNKDAQNSELVKALRHCDGAHVQCIVMVRDDFWLAVSRFLQDLEVDAVPGRNVALVDLFSVDHAKSVLAAFGRAFGKLPETAGLVSRDQKTFLNNAVQGLADEGKVVSVRLSLFAEMMKDKSWTSTTLKEIGGATGIGVAFLEDAFSSSTAFPKHRLHQVAARRVLESLLPDSGTDIKGHMKSSDELCAASGYVDRRRDFDDLLRILDGELRLITPTELEEVAGDQWRVASEDNVSGNRATHHPAPATPNPPRFYQLTHDYLVPSLRDWLTQKQRETRRGRAELLLAERFALWNRKPENRNLPSAWEWLKIRLLTVRKRQTLPQREMLRQARRVHGLRWGIGLVTTMVIGIAMTQWVRNVRFNNLMDRMRTAVDTVASSDGAAVPVAVLNLGQYPSEHVLANLESRFAESHDSQKLALACAMAKYGKVDVDFIVDSIQNAPPSEVDNLAAALRQSKSDSVNALRRAAESRSSENDWVGKQRLAVVALHIGDASIASEMCQIRPDRIERLDFVLAWPAWRGDTQQLADFAGQLNDPALQSGLLTGLGAVRLEEVTIDAKRAWQPILTNWFQHANDAAVHSAAEWLLRRWRLEIPSIAASNAPVDGHQWQITKNSLSMVRIPAGTFQRRYGLMAKIAADPEFLTAPLQTVMLTHPILMSDREVTVRQFQQMMDDPTYNANEKAVRWRGADPVSSPTPDHPVQNVNWNDAVRFCNWLSHTEGLTPAYERTGKVWTMPAEGSRSRDFEEWRLVDRANGYRLPTSAEWEYACRAGSNTQDPFGDKVNTRFLEAFANTQSRVVLIEALEFNAEKCGSTPPNAWGLFDLHGNVREWIQDWVEAYPGQSAPDVDNVTDPTGPVENDPNLFKQIRDGIFYRTSTALVIDARFLGFRVVRTVE